LEVCCEDMMNYGFTRKKGPLGSDPFLFLFFSCGFSQ
jgi:hypothetical protein